MSRINYSQLRTQAILNSNQQNDEVFVSADVGQGKILFSKKGSNKGDSQEIGSPTTMDPAIRKAVFSKLQEVGYSDKQIQSIFSQYLKNQGGIKLSELRALAHDKIAPREALIGYEMIKGIIDNPRNSGKEQISFDMSKGYGKNLHSSRRIIQPGDIEKTELSQGREKVEKFVSLKLKAMGMTSDAANRIMERYLGKEGNITVGMLRDLDVIVQTYAKSQAIINHIRSGQADINSEMGNIKELLNGHKQLKALIESEVKRFLGNDNLSSLHSSLHSGDLNSAAHFFQNAHPLSLALIEMGAGSAFCDEITEFIKFKNELDEFVSTDHHELVGDKARDFLIKLSTLRHIVKEKLNISPRQRNSYINKIDNFAQAMAVHIEASVRQQRIDQIVDAQNYSNPIDRKNEWNRVQQDLYPNLSPAACMENTSGIVQRIRDFTSSEPEKHLHQRSFDKRGIQAAKACCLKLDENIREVFSSFDDPEVDEEASPSYESLKREFLKSYEKTLSGNKLDDFNDLVDGYMEESQMSVDQYFSDDHMASMVAYRTTSYAPLSEIYENMPLSSMRDQVWSHMQSLF